MLDLSIVILTFNSLGMLKDCIASLRETVKNISYEIIVVDNGSADSTANWLGAQPDIRPILNTENRGVAPARNQGLALCGGRYLMILDVDTIVTPGAIDTLVRSMDENPDAGLGAPKLTDADGNLQYTCRYYPTVLSKIYRRLPFRFAQEALRRELLMDWDHASACVCDYAIGACQIFRREARAQVGPLDEAVFYGPEDIDYCLRMWAAGWKVMYFPDAAVRHLEQRITRKMLSRTTWRHGVGLVHYFRKYGYMFNTKKLPGCEKKKAKDNSKAPRFSK